MATAVLGKKTASGGGVVFPPRLGGPDADLSGPQNFPDIIEFVISDKYLNRGELLYPRQATLLKVMFCQLDLLTEYDKQVLGEWSEGFRLPDPGEFANIDPEDSTWFRYQPSGALAVGIQPDWETRVNMNLLEGRNWFRETDNISGRRGSKGHIGGLAGAYVLKFFFEKGDPQGHYGVRRDKKLQAIVFAGKKEQAKANQWRDLVDVIIGAPCFRPYIANALGESLTLYAPWDEERMKELRGARINTSMDLATFEIVPKESTLMAGRGPTSFMQFYDEMAHVVATGANRSAEDVYGAATPALDQFGIDGFIYSGSSPWQMVGQLYANYNQALALDPVTRLPLRPEMLMIQLPSWGFYEDFDIAHKISMLPWDHERKFRRRDGTIATRERPSYAKHKYFNRIARPIQAYDAQMRRIERANPDTFKVERLSQWATALNAYLDPVQIEEMFGEWPPGSGEKLVMQSEGKLAISYTAHGDPSKSGANFGWAIAHAVGPDSMGLYHVVFDQIHAWLPSDYPDGRIDYIDVEADIIERAKRFMPSTLTFDQFNSAGMIQRIGRALRSARLPKNVMVGERTATAPLNWRMAETFKTALNMGLIHAPYHELAELELRFLQLTTAQKVDHQTSGPVQTKDVADAMFNVVYDLIGEQMGLFLKGELSGLPLSGSQAGGLNENPPTAVRDEDVFNALGAGGRPPQYGNLGRRRR